jgi:hypothetical protein
MVKQIPNEMFEAITRNRTERKYLGMSEAGHPCQRHVWYAFHRFTPVPIDGRTLLIFEFGDHIEQIIVRWLRGAGYRLENAYPERQLEFTALHGWLRGHCDGVIVIDGRKSLLECKSANKKKFQAFAMAGVKATYPIYYAQAQFYLRFAQLPSCLFVIMCKDNCEIYTELVPFDQAESDRLMARTAKIILADDVPAKEFEQSSIDCQWCNYRLHCWDKAIQQDQSCMNCHYLKIQHDGLAQCQHAAHPGIEVKDAWLKCPQYSWLGRTPF